MLCGLDGCGKTTILYRLRLKEVNKNFKETKGFNYEIVKQEFQGSSYELHIWDLAGKKELRHLWNHFYSCINFDVVLFCVDANDTDRFEEAYGEFYKLIHEERLRNAIIIVLLNIHNVGDGDRLRPGEVKTKFRLSELKYVSAKVLEINAFSGDGFPKVFKTIFKGVKNGLQ